MADDVEVKKRRGRPPRGVGADPLLPSIKVMLPVSLLACVDSYLIDVRRVTPSPLVLSRSEGIRRLLTAALAAWRHPRRHRGFEMEEMPRDLMVDHHVLQLRLLASLAAEIEAYRAVSRTQVRLIAIQDLLWNGLRLWGHLPRQPKPPG